MIAKWAQEDVETLDNLLNNNNNNNNKLLTKTLLTMLPYFLDSKPHFCCHFSIPENRVQLRFDGAYIRKVLPEYNKCIQVGAKYNGPLNEI